MRALIVGGWLLGGMASQAAAVIRPASVVVVYNTAVAESLQLARVYQQARGIPEDQLVGLAMPNAADITRDQYEQSVARPLRAEFDRRGWWKRRRGADGVTLPVLNQIRVVVTMRGVPLRIQARPKPAGAGPAQPGPAGRDEAALDSELAMFGVEGTPVEGPLANKFYQSKRPIDSPDLPFLVLTSRIDAVSAATCERMIRDAVAAENTGLWGMAYIDIANKYPQGDQWLEAVAQATAAAGIPTVVDRFNETLPRHYPMRDAALYFGWYDWNASGPLLNPRFKFRTGAVAMHLHSFSAEQLVTTQKNWSAALLEKGAAVTIGNVYEPYLQMTHDFGLLQQSLLEGDCWVEACWKAMPVVSWQGVVLGDPLYRPFKHLSGSGERVPGDEDYRALRAAMLRWPDDRGERVKQYGAAAVRTSSGVFAEAAGLELLRGGLKTDATRAFDQARALYVAAEDKMRQDFHQIAMRRSDNQKDAAVRLLRGSLRRFAGLPEAEALQAWLDLLDPPAKPAAAKSASPNNN